MSPDDKPEKPKNESFSFQDLMSDMGELPVAEPKTPKPAPVPPLNRNRVEAGPDAPPRPGVPKAIYDRPRPLDAPTPRNIPSGPGGAPGAKVVKGQPAAIFFEDDRRKAIREEQEEADKKQDEFERINSRVLSGSGYQSKPLWTTALLFAAITAGLLFPNLSDNAYREMFDPYLSFAVIFFGGITVLISASGVLNEESIFGRLLCLCSLGVGAAACYFVYPNLHF